MSQDSDKNASKEKKPNNNDDDVVSQLSFEVNSNCHPSSSLDLHNQYALDNLIQQRNHFKSHQAQDRSNEEATNLIPFQPSITSISDSFVSVNYPLVGRNFLRSTIAQQTYLQSNRAFIKNLQYQQQLSISRNQLIDSLQSKVNVRSDRIHPHAAGYVSDQLPILADQWSHAARQAIPSISLFSASSGNQGL